MIEFFFVFIFYAIFYAFALFIGSWVGEPDGVPADLGYDNQNTELYDKQDKIRDILDTRNHVKHRMQIQRVLDAS